MRVFVIFPVLDKAESFFAERALLFLKLVVLAVVPFQAKFRGEFSAAFVQVAQIHLLPNLDYWRSLFIALVHLWTGVHGFTFC